MKKLMDALFSRGDAIDASTLRGMRNRFHRDIQRAEQRREEEARERDIANRRAERARVAELKRTAQKKYISTGVARLIAIHDGLDAKLQHRANKGESFLTERLFIFDPHTPTLGGYTYGEAITDLLKTEAMRALMQTAKRKRLRVYLEDAKSTEFWSSGTGPTQSTDTDDGLILYISWTEYRAAFWRRVRHTITGALAIERFS